MHEHDSSRPSSSESGQSSSPSVGEALVVGSALTQRAARDAVARPASAGMSLRADGHGGRSRVMVRQRRGVVLVFVVVLLTLLGIMGTAYLASSRLDRQAIIGRGSLTGTQTALLKDSSTLDKLQTGVEQAVEQAMIRDLFNIAPGTDMGTDPFKVTAFGTFRQTSATVLVGGAPFPKTWYENYDAPGRADPWLSSLLPTRRSATNASPVWPWISGPLITPTYATTPVTRVLLPGTAAQADPFFSDPRLMTNSGPNGAAGARFGIVDPSEVYPGQNAPVDDVAVTDRHNPFIGFVSMLRTAGADNVRMYPGITPVAPSLASGNTFIAGDADGDGIADSALQPIRINPTATGNVVNQYLDTTNNVIYYAAYRIVDNSAKLNLGTALDVRGDVTEMAVIPSTSEGADSGPHNATSYGSVNSVAAGTPELREYLTENPNLNNAAPPAGLTTPAPGTFGPNYGFFRSNVGLTGVLRQLLTPINQANDTNDSNRVPFQQDLRRLMDLRFPLLKQNPAVTGTYPYMQAAMSDDKDIQKLAFNFTYAGLARLKLGTTNALSVVAAPLAPYPLQLKYRSFGDLLEQQVARRYSSPGGYLWQTSTTASPMVASNSLPAVGFGDTASLSAKGGTLVNDLVSPGGAEQALLFSLRMSTPNVNNNGDAPWGWFPPNAVNLWFGWTQDFDVDVTTPPVSTLPSPIRPIDAATAGDRAFSYVLANDPLKPAGTADVVLPRSPRVLFTTYNGITSTTPTRGDQSGFPSSVGVCPTPGLPIGMPAYTPFDARDNLTGLGHKANVIASAIGQDPYTNATTPPTYFTYPNVKVSAATGTKEQLWRAYWSAMTQQVPFTYAVGGVTYQSSFWDAARRNDSYLWAAYDSAHYYDAFRAPDRYGSNEDSGPPDPALSYQTTVGAPYDESQRPDQVMSTRQMALIRSAVAACNTIDLRDNDNDITAMDVDVTDDNLTTATRYYARVYGTEKQLVISGIYMRGGTVNPYVAVEIYNPTDVPIQLSAYRLALLQHRAGTSTKADGVIDLPVGLTDSIRLSNNSAQTLAPGGYVVLYSTATLPVDATFVRPAVPPSYVPHTPTIGVPDVYVVTPGSRDGDTTGAPFTAVQNLGQLVTGGYELVLARTRRADGHPFRDQTAATAGVVRTTIENETANDADLVEDTAANTDVRTLVTLDGVDARILLPAGATPRAVYLRQRPAPLTAGSGSANAPLGTEADARQDAWRCFYAGPSYQLRIAGPRAPGGTQAAADPERAWDDAGTTVVTFAPTASVGPPPFTAATATVRAPAIPIQNFRPVDPYTESNTRPVSATPDPNTAYGVANYGPAVAADPTLRGIFHLVNEFPYGSPFAREMDLQAVPYIGTYKIYRAAGGAVDLYEFVPLPMDAVNVAPVPDAAVSSGNLANQITTIGRFDPRPDALPALANAWAANLTDFVTARHAPYKTYFPDVPAVTFGQTFYNTQESATLNLNGDQRYAQDGPVTGSLSVGANVNTYNDVGWVSFVERGAADTAITAPGYRDGLRTGIDTKTGAGSSLIQGVVNVNTAPQIVLRQLPWVVSSDTGQADFPSNGLGADLQVRTTVNDIVTNGTLGRDVKAAANWVPTAVSQTFGFPSLAALNDPTTGIGSISTNGTLASGALAPPQAEATNLNLLKLGMLNPQYRNELQGDYLVNQLNIGRVSNLLTTRSDVYTVYVTVQAWTWAAGVGGTQATDTRLVGERRSSFVVDRSKIDPDHFNLSDLTILPIERE